MKFQIEDRHNPATLIIKKIEGPQETFNAEVTKITHGGVDWVREITVHNIAPSVTESLSGMKLASMLLKEHLTNKRPGMWIQDKVYHTYVWTKYAGR